MTLLYLSICQLIPLLGSILMMGYQFEIVEALHRCADAEYPKFDFNRFLEYLMRGLWPFLVTLVVSAVSVVFIIPLWCCILFLPAALSEAGGDAAIIGVLLMTLFLVLVGLGLSLLFALVLVPMLLRAGLSQDFATAFDMSFVRDFIRRVWLEIVLEQLFLIVTGILLACVGSLLCCIGALPAYALFIMAQAYIYHQLYRLYLARGGTPIPLKAPPATAPPVRTG